MTAFTDVVAELVRRNKTLELSHKCLDRTPHDDVQFVGETFSDIQTLVDNVIARHSDIEGFESDAEMYRRQR